MRRPLIILGIATFALTLALRLRNETVAISNGIPQLSLLDDLYQFKRIAYTAENFPRVLDFDSDRGVRGEFCPWPPLYDFAAGTAARLLGAHTPPEVLDRVVWFPPFFSAAFVAIAAICMARLFGLWPAAALALALAMSPFLIAESSIGNIDHHFLEAPLTFGIVLATCAALRGADRKQGIARGICLGVALIAALYIRTALLIAAAIAFAILFALSDGLAAACGFGMAAIAVALYRITRLPSYPDSEWFLGWSHAALLAGAAMASLLLFLRGRSAGNRIVALLCGTALVVLTPTALPAILFGSEYLGGNPWFRTIVEGQPLWNTPPFEIVWRIAGLSTGAILVWLLVIHAIRHRDAVRGAIAVFAAAYLLLTVSSVRFWSVGIPLLALAAAVYAASIRRRTLVILACVAVAVPPLVQFAIWHRRPLPPVIGRQELPWLRAALVLRDRAAAGRVLAPWSMGHAIDVIGQKPVIIDNFGVMSDEVDFERAHDAFLALDEETLLRYCEGAGVRFVVLDNPLYGLQGVAATLGIDPSRFVLTNARGEPTGVTRLATRTWWWRAYYGRGPFPNLRLIYADRQPSWEGTPVFRGPAVMIYEVERRPLRPTTG